MGLFGKSTQQQFNELCTQTLIHIQESSASADVKEFFSLQFLGQAKAAADDKSSDVIGLTKQASHDALFMVRFYAESDRNRKSGNK